MVKMSGTKPVALVLLIMAALQGLAACIPILLGTVGVTAIDVSLDRRTVGRNLDDNTLELRLRTDVRTDDSLGSAVNVSVTAINGIVLLTGEVNNDEQRRRAVELARSYEETRKVVNELELSGKTNINSRANDSWITAKVKTELFTTKNLPANAIKVVTERGKVYLLGLVTRQEAEAAVEATRTIRGVTHIVKVFEYVS